MEANATGLGGGSMPDMLLQVMVESFGPAGPYYVIAAFGIMMVVIALPFLLRREPDPMDRLADGEGRQEAGLDNLRSDRDSGAMRGIGEFLEPETEEEMSETRQKLAAAGYRDLAAVRIYYFTRAALGIGLLVFGLVAMLLVPKEPDLAVGVAVAAVFGLAGYFVPAYWVTRQIQTRRDEIQNAFPDAMDMMLVCIEGGQSLEQAMARVGKEMENSSGPLAEELNTVSHEFRAGKDRISVLRDFAARCSVNDISSFVTVLVQSTAFGTSISDALRVYASEMRDKRLMRAEEKANVLPTKLTLGTMMFTVPPLILILIGPSVVQIMRALTGLAAQ